MISEQWLALLRCPMNPKETPLLAEEKALVCERCALRFPIKEGIPALIVQDAQLPEGCESLEDLPCQQDKRKG
ncbi:MAG: Trm112 family protein [Gemmataceae bacterium]